MRQLVLSFAVAIGALAAHPRAYAEPLAERYLLEGQLAEGEAALVEHLKSKPNDDEARFGLGATQFLLTFEHLGRSLHEFGLRSERAFPGAPREFRELLPQNPKPKEISNEDARKIIQTFVDDLSKAEATLSQIKDDNVKLPLHVGLIKVDLFGQGKPVNAAFVLGQVQSELPDDPVRSFVIGFDRGDVHWLRGYCHFLCAWGELILAVDTQELFDCTAHLFFEKTASPHKFLQEEARDLEGLGRFDRALFSDIIAFIHLLRFPLKDADRMQASLRHLEAMIDQAQEMWTHYNAEMDNDNEWIPNPRQKGVMQISVTEPMVTAWLDTVAEAEQVVQAKKLIPFWRGGNPKRGVNLRRVFTEPTTLDPILWVQGTAATPYLEEGPITELATPETLRRLNETFGGVNFFGFAFWFN